MSAGTVEAGHDRAPPARLLTMLALLWLSGAALRLTVLGVPPVVPRLHEALHISETQLGILSSLPSLLFSAAAVPGSLLIARFGAVPTLVTGLLLNAAGSALRGAAPGVPALYAATILMGFGVALMQPAMPPLARAWLPRRIGFATAIYGNGLLLGEVLVVALTIPLVLPLVGGSWRWNFVAWAVPVLVTALLVAVLAPRAAKASVAAPPLRWWPDWRSGLIWRLGLMLGSVNSIYFVTNNFLPDYLTAAGQKDLIGAGLTALNLAQLPASFLMLAFAGRLARRRSAYVAAGGLTLVALLGMVSSGGLWIVFWVGVLGFATAILLILSLALPPLLSKPEDVHRTSAAMFTISYMLAVVTPIVGGWLWDRTGLAVAGFAPIVVCGLAIGGLAATIDFRRH